jgi:hypothetical protein
MHCLESKGNNVGLTVLERTSYWSRGMRDCDNWWSCWSNKQGWQLHLYCPSESGLRSEETESRDGRLDDLVGSGRGETQAGNGPEDGGSVRIERKTPTHAGRRFHFLFLVARAESNHRHRDFQSLRPTILRTASVNCKSIVIEKPHLSIVSNGQVWAGVLTPTQN